MHPPPLAGRDDNAERATPAFPGKVDLACEPTSRAPQGLIGTMTCRAPAPTRDLRGPGGGTSRVLMSARLVVESTLTMLQSIRASASASPWRARRILSHVPSADHLR